MLITLYVKTIVIPEKMKNALKTKLKNKKANKVQYL
jgi:hypothetical protein